MFFQQGLSQVLPLINRFGRDTDLLLYSTGTTQFAQSMATVSVQVIGELTELEEKANVLDQILSRPGQPECWQNGGGGGGGGGGGWGGGGGNRGGGGGGRDRWYHFFLVFILL